MARGGSRGRRSYVRDGNGRFSSTPGGGASRTSPGARRAARPKATGGTLTARARLRAARAKLTPGASRQQKGAVTRAGNTLRAAQASNRTKLKAVPMAGRVRVGKGGKLKGRQQQAAPQATTQRRGRQPNLKAQRAKAMAERRGTVAGRNFQDGQARQTLSLKEMRAAVRKELRKGGIETRKQFEAVYGKAPTTRGGWERLYRENVAVPQSDRGRKGRPGVINGIDIQKQFRPWQVFGLNPKTATREDVNRAFRRLALQHHPDQGGRRKDMERLQKMRDSVLAFMPEPKPPKGSKPAKGGGRKGKSSKASASPAPAAPQGPKLLPPAREAAKPAKPKRSRSKAAPGGKAPSAPKLNGKDWDSLARLKGAVPFDRGRGQTGYFIPDSSLTPARRKKLGLGAFKTQVDGGNFAAQRQTFGSQEGWVVSPRAPRGETPPQLQRRKSSRKPKSADDLLTQATRIEQMGRRMSRAARTGARDRQIEERAVRAARAARQRALDMQKPPSKAELKRREQRLRSSTTAGLNARLAADYAARNRR